MQNLDPNIFKAYDIRGVAGENLTAEVVELIGRVLGTEAAEQGVKALCVGRDGRLSGPELSEALIRGIISAGTDVYDIGMEPTPVLYFATHYFGTGSGVAVTGSHNPSRDNGLKMMMAGKTLFGPLIQEIRARVERGDWRVAEKPGTVYAKDAETPYFEKITGDVKLARPMKVILDSGNGVTGPLALRLFKALGCEVEGLFTEVDGHFPHHHPDPSKPKNLEDLIRRLRESDAEVGLAFDGDGDRLGVVTKAGEIIYPDRQMMLFAADVLEKKPGSQIIYDVKCTRRLVDWVKDHGGVPTISCTGHSFVKGKLFETKAPFAGEMSGHIFFNDGRWPGFDDGLYAGARMLEILSRSADPGAVLHALPTAVNTPELQIPMAEGENKKFVARLQQELHFEDAIDEIRIDGLRVEWADGFALARASNTTPVVVLRLEGDTEQALERIKKVFGGALKRLAPEISLPF